ncbi:hypothetical protein ACFPPD_23275 [Cohnella suwonensis]|uniref:Uncharacterized protein n=1 Tax=Cohnella suwonensis TaxID=696072 RepID=A0ABW0M448_9BACL
MRLLFILILLFGLAKDTPISSNLEPEDFDIYYNEVKINDQVNVLRIKSLLGFGEDFEDNNNGYISGFGDIRRLNAVYPNHESPELRLVFLTNDNESYLVFAELDTLNTNRGVKAGDTYDKLIEKYGNPNFRFEPYEEYETLRYNYGKKYIDFVLKNEDKKIEYILIDYNSYRADKEQKFNEE